MDAPGGGTHVPKPVAAEPDASVGGDREFWRGVLLAGGFSAIPRWTQQPSTGMAECEARVRNSVSAGLRRLADAWSIPLSAFFLAAHARVVAALCGEPTVVTGHVLAAGSEALPCRLSTEAASWQELIHDAWRSETELMAHRDFPVEQLRRDLGLTNPCFETVLDPTGVDGWPAPYRFLDPDRVFWVGVLDRGNELVLRVRYRHDLLDGPAAARVAAYHVGALG
jgi:hypothetical protein